jgi:hypothetical protein
MHFLLRLKDLRSTWQVDNASQARWPSLATRVVILR